MNEPLRTLVAACASLLVCASLAHAAQPEPDAAHQLVQLLHADAVSQQSVRQMRAYASAAIEREVTAHPELSPQQVAVMRRYPEQVATLVKSELKWDSLFEAYDGIYRQHYTPAELQALLRFYQSPEGASIKAKQVALSMDLLKQSSQTLGKAHKTLQTAIDAQVVNLVSASKTSP